jgi:plastocyanin
MEEEVRIREVLQLLAACLLIILARPVAAATVPVSIINYTFVPDTAQIVQGDSVVWTNNGTHQHTATSGAHGVPDSLWDSGYLNPGDMYGHKFPNVGSFPYFCKIHYPMNGMSGLIVVKSAGVEENGSRALEPRPALAAAPNPFGAATRITYSAGSARALSLIIYDAAGHTVRNLAAERTGTTPPPLLWDGRNNDGKLLPPGVYFCRLVTANAGLELKLLKLE